MTREIRVAELIKREMAFIIQHKLNDNRIGFVSITRVDLTKDIKNAKVYISTFGTEKDRKKAMDGLNHAKGFLKRELAQVLKIRQIPDIHFVDDHSLEEGDRIITKLKKLSKEDQ